MVCPNTTCVIILSCCESKGFVWKFYSDTGWTISPHSEMNVSRFFDQTCPVYISVLKGVQQEIIRMTFDRWNSRDTHKPYPRRKARVQEVCGRSTSGRFQWTKLQWFWCLNLQVFPFCWFLQQPVTFWQLFCPWSSDRIIHLVLAGSLTQKTSSISRLISSTLRVARSNLVRHW